MFGSYTLTPRCMDHGKPVQLGARTTSPGLPLNPQAARASDHPTRKLPVPPTIQPTGCLSPSSCAPRQAGLGQEALLALQRLHMGTLRCPSPPPYTLAVRCHTANNATHGSSRGAAPSALCCAGGTNVARLHSLPRAVAGPHLNCGVLSRLAPGHLGHILAALQHLKSREGQNSSWLGGLSGL